MVAALVVFGAACGSDDDGAAVRNIGGESSGSGSHSGSGSGSGSASAPASGSASASGSEAAVGCNVVDGTEATGDATTVEVALDEWSVAPDPASVPAGLVTFTAANIGEEEHELAVVRAEDVDELPTADDGSVDLEADEVDLIGEIEAFPSGETCEGTFELEAGDYVLLCNLVHEGHDGGHDEVHVELGMHVPFTVTG